MPEEQGISEGERIFLDYLREQGITENDMRIAVLYSKKGYASSVMEGFEGWGEVTSATLEPGLTLEERIRRARIEEWDPRITSLIPADRVDLEALIVFHEGLPGDLFNLEHSSEDERQELLRIGGLKYPKLEELLSILEEVGEENLALQDSRNVVLLGDKLDVEGETHLIVIWQGFLQENDEKRSRKLELVRERELASYIKESQAGAVAPVIFAN